MGAGQAERWPDRYDKEDQRLFAGKQDTCVITNRWHLPLALIAFNPLRPGLRAVPHIPVDIPRREEAGQSLRVPYVLQGEPKHTRKSQDRRHQREQLPGRGLRASKRCNSAEGQTKNWFRGYFMMVARPLEQKGNHEQHH